MCEGGHTLGHILPAEGISATEQPPPEFGRQSRGPYVVLYPYPLYWLVYHPRRFRCFLSRRIAPIRQETSASRPHPLDPHGAANDGLPWEVCSKGCPHCPEMRSRLPDCSCVRASCWEQTEGGLRLGLAPGWLFPLPYLILTLLTAFREVKP